SGFAFPGFAPVHLPWWVVLAIRIASLIGKVVFFCWFFIWVRWTIPRFRYDQVMRLGWKVMLPLSLLNIFVTGLILLLYDKGGF
ncbi:MAG TPA: NADH-quinone oxidoreductase subunit H, partial [Candidatus Deferrimicrobiaceae bacterium]